MWRQRIGDDPNYWVPLLEQQAITLDISLPTEEQTVYYKV